MRLGPLVLAGLATLAFSVDAGAAQCRPILVFYSGGNDQGDSSPFRRPGDYKRLAKFCREYTPPVGVRKVCKAWTQDETESILRLWRHLDQTPIVLVGYSLGGDTAYEVARELRGRWPTLVTLDPVSSRGITPWPVKKPMSHRKWIHVYTKDDPKRNSACNTIGVVAAWGRLVHADVVREYADDHCDAQGMFEAVKRHVDDALACPKS